MLAARFGLERVTLVNDYAAMARSIPELSQDAFKVIHEGQPSSTPAPILVGGPGTGLGIATLLPESAGWRVVTGEGGHTAYAPRTDREMALSHELQRRFDYISSELVLSGSGLDAVHKALCAIDGVEWTPLDVTTILSRAQAGDIICHDICVIRAGGVLQALGDAALINGTRGGVVVTGGVAERLYDYLCEAC